MGSRSRKAGRRGQAAGERDAGERSATGGPAGGAGPDGAGREPAVPRGYERSRAKNDLIRAGLQPYGPDERPTPLVVAAVVAALLGLVNALGFALGWEVQGEEPSAGVLAFSGLMLVAAWGIWTKRYWAVLGFQALMALIAIAFFLSLLIASDVLAVLLCLVAIGAAGTMFFKLIRVMARMQVPERPRREGTG